MRSTGKAHTLRGLAALALVLGVGVGVGGGCFALGVEFDQALPKQCTPKTVVDDCGAGNDCGERLCTDGYCDIRAKPKGTLTNNQVIADCKQKVCDGKGNIVEEPSDVDVVADSNPCTKDKCVEGVPTYEPETPGEPCGRDNSLQCDSTGSCIGCEGDKECDLPGDCSSWTCDTATKVCNLLISPAGTPISNEVLYDCKSEFCGITGQKESRPDDTDILDDKNPCTTDACNNGAPVNPAVAVPNGTPCETGCKMCVNGQCGECNALPDDYACKEDMSACVPLKKQDNGVACTSTFDCLSGNCVDGVCCDSTCEGPCMACSNAKSGQPDGTCSPIATGTDPDNECKEPGGDVCNAGKCQCYNGVLDGAEVKVDCGGNCTPCPGMWVCDGMPAACEGQLHPSCCAPACGGCMNQTATCKDTHGKACQLGELPKFFSLGLGNTTTCSNKNSQTCFYSWCFCQ